MRWAVVGAGTAGCVVAAHLAADPDNAVTVIERGPDLTAASTPAAIRAIDYTAALATDRVDRSVRVRRTLASAPIGYALGCGVGGSSAINGMLIERGDLAQYAAWGWDDAAGAFDRVRLPARSVTDDDLGPIDLALQMATSTARHAVLAADHRGRVSVADVYLDPARESSTVSVLARRAVAALTTEGDRVTGVVLADGGMVESDAVVLCAGAIATPLLMLRSGFAVDGLGEGLTDHPSATINVRLHHSQPDPAALVTTGILAGDDRVQVTAMSHVGVTPGDQAFGAVTVALLRPRSRGGIAVSSDGSPHIDLAQYSDDHDLEEMIDAVEILEDRVSQLGDVIDEATIDDHGTPVSALSSRAAIATWLRSCSGTYVHPAASCPMGRVVDDAGRVVGIPNLFVIDASVFPEIPAAPTYLPTVMLAERLAPRLMSSVR